MDNDQADKRIEVSKAAFTRYQEMAIAGYLPVADLKLMLREIDLLERIAHASDRWDECEAVAIQWKALADALKAHIN